LLSEEGSKAGGSAKSLKVVSTSDWLADVWILSSARAICSLSAAGEDTESDIVESRRGRESVGDGGAEGPKEGPKDGFLSPLGSAAIVRTLYGCCTDLGQFGEPVRSVESKSMLLQLGHEQQSETRGKACARWGEAQVAAR
jgi:hypothetical protein